MWRVALRSARSQPLSLSLPGLTPLHTQWWGSAAVAVAAGGELLVIGGLGGTGKGTAAIDGLSTGTTLGVASAELHGAVSALPPVVAAAAAPPATNWPAAAAPAAQALPLAAPPHSCRHLCSGLRQNN
eukprot:1156227-Pelagomonas_calceolata.AAC.3